MLQSQGWPPRYQSWPAKVDQSNHGSTIHCPMSVTSIPSCRPGWRGGAFFGSGRAWGDYGRDNAGHDTLVIAEEKDTEGYKHTREVATWLSVSRVGSLFLREEHSQQWLSYQALYLGVLPAAGRHDGGEKTLNSGYSARSWSRDVDL